MEELINIISKIKDVNNYNNNNLLLYEYLINNENYKSEIICCFVIKGQDLDLNIQKDSEIKIRDFIKDIPYEHCYNKCSIYLDEINYFNINEKVDYNLIIKCNSYKIYLYLIENNYDIDYFQLLDLSIKENNEIFFNITIMKYKPLYYHINNILLLKRYDLLKTLIELKYNIQKEFYNNEEFDNYKEENVIDRIDLLIKSSILKNSEETFFSSFDNLQLNNNGFMTPKTDKRIRLLEQPYMDIVLYQNRIYTNYDFEEIFKKGTYNGKRISNNLRDLIENNRAACKRLGLLKTEPFNKDYREDYIKIYDEIFILPPQLNKLKNIYGENFELHDNNENVLKILYIDACKNDFKNIKLLV